MGKEEAKKIPTGNLPYIRNIREIADRFFGWKRLIKGGEIEEVEDLGGEFDVWKSGGGSINYLVKSNGGEANKPSVGVLTEKVLVVLISYCIEQYKEESGKVTATFTLNGLMNDLGYSEEEVRKGGNRLSHIINSVMTLSQTSYRKIEPSPRQGMMNIYYRNFLDLDIEAPEEAVVKMFKNKRQIPTGQDVKITIKINDIHSRAIKEYIAKGAGKFFLIEKRLIGDRKMNDNISLFKLAAYIHYTKGGGEFPIGMRNLLKEVMHIDDSIVRGKPTRCFNYIKTNVATMAKDYPDLFKGIKLFNRNKTEWIWLGLDELLLLEKIEYVDFKQTTLELLGEKDLRNCHIVFCQEGHKPAIQAHEETDEVVQSDLAKRIIQWVHKRLPYDKLHKITPDGTENFIRNSIEKLGEGPVRLAFERELKKEKPDAYHLVVVTLSNMMKGFKATKMKGRSGNAKNTDSYRIHTRSDIPERIVEVKANISEIVKQMKA